MMSWHGRRSRRIWSRLRFPCCIPKAAVVNSLMDKIAAKCKTNPKKTEDSKPKGRSVDSLYERLNLLKN